MRYEKGRKDASRRQITAVAAETFKRGGIAASGLSGIMKEAGLTNGAFYPHFRSKEALVRESLIASLEAQFDQIGGLLEAGGPDLLIESYLSAQHRDNPASGCASAALLPEVAREPAETRHAYTQHLQAIVRQLAEYLPGDQSAREARAFGVFATLLGTLELARAVNDEQLSDRILADGVLASKALVAPKLQESS